MEWKKNNETVSGADAETGRYWDFPEKKIIKNLAFAGLSNRLWQPFCK